MKQDAGIYFDLITSIETAQEADSLSSEIDTLEDALFQAKNMSLDMAIASIGISTGQKIKKIFAKNNLDFNNKEAVSAFLQALKDLIKKFKVIKLILAFDPSPNTIAKIHASITKTIGIGYVLDIEASEKIMAGAVVIFNGNYNDFTLRKSLEEAFLDKREEVLRLMQFQNTQKTQ